MMRNKTPRDGWAAAKAHSFVTAPNREAHVSFAEKVRQGEALRAQVEAHIAAGGQYQVLPCGTAAQVSA